MVQNSSWVYNHYVNKHWTCFLWNSRVSRCACSFALLIFPYFLRLVIVNILYHLNWLYYLEGMITITTVSATNVLMKSHAEVVFFTGDIKIQGIKYFYLRNWDSYHLAFSWKWWRTLLMYHKCYKWSQNKIFGLFYQLFQPPTCMTRPCVV